MDQDSTLGFALNFDLLRYSPQNPNTISSVDQDWAEDLWCTFYPVMLNDSRANMQIQCNNNNTNFNNMSSDLWQPPTSEQVLVSVNLNPNWRITEPRVQSISGTVEGGFNVSIQFEAICSPCTYMDGYILAKASISLVDW